MSAVSSNKPEPWVNDCILQYLRSPLWTVPTEDFIDKHCHEFKSDEEENKLIYTELHTQFRTLVENLLTSFIEELGLEIETLVEAVKCPNPESPTEVEVANMILSYIVALDDYPTFRSIMEKRNAEMDLEVMHEFARHTSAGGENMEDMTDEEQFMLEMAIRLSLAESDISFKQFEVEDNEMIHEMMVQLAVEHERIFHELRDKEQIAEQQRILIESANTELLAKREENIAAVIETKHQNAKEGKETNAPSTKDAPDVRKITIPTNDRASPKKQVQSLLGPIIDRRKEVFGSKGSVLPVIPKKTAGSSESSPANNLISQQPTFETLKKEVEEKSKPTGPSPSKEELEQRAEYFKKQREKLRQAKVHERAQELEEFKKENKIEGATTDLTSMRAKEICVALVRRFREDLVQESKGRK